ncbi:MAG: hypothetical protein ACPHZ7_03245 [Vibrio toranzoniae]
MGSKPKKQEYKASEAEKQEARIAAEKASHFRKNYAPLNEMELRDSMSDDVKNLARGRGNADVMQGLTSRLNYQQTQNAGDMVADLSGAYQGTLGQATSGALDVQNKRGTAAVGAAQGQSATSAQASSLLTNIGTNRVLEKAKNKQMLKNARLAAGMKVAGAGMDKAMGDNENWQKFKDYYKANS